MLRHVARAWGSVAWAGGPCVDGTNSPSSIPSRGISTSLRLRGARHVDACRLCRQRGATHLQPHATCFCAAAPDSRRRHSLEYSSVAWECVGAGLRYTLAVRLTLCELASLGQAE